MAYVVTLEFPQATLEDGTTLDLTFRFAVDDSGSNRTDNTEDNGIVATDLGTTTWEFDYDNLFLTPGEQTFVIGDGDEYLRDLLMDQTAEGVATDKDFEVEIELDSVTETLGNCIERTIRYDVGKKELTFTVSPRIDIINKTDVFNGDGVMRDPLDYNGETPDAISAFAVVYNGDDAELEITHAGGTTYLANDIIKIAGVTATERNIAYINDSYTVISVADGTHFKVKAPAMIEEDIDLTFSFGTVVNLSLSFTSFATLRGVLNDIYGLVDSSASTLFDHDWEINVGWTCAVDISNATESGGTVTITHSENVQAGAQNADLAVDDEVVIIASAMTDLNGTHTVTAANSATEFEISLATAQSFSGTARVRKIDPIDIAGFFLSVGFLSENLFTSDAFGISNLGDVLRAISKDFFAFTGMLHKERPFFRKIDYYDSGDLQTLATVLKRIELHTLDRYSFVENTYTYDTDKTKRYSYGDPTDLSDQHLSQESFIATIQSRETTAASGNQVHDFFETTTAYVIATTQGVSFKDPTLDFGEGDYYNWKPNLNLLPRLWWRLFGKDSTMRLEELTVTGVGYNFLKNFEYDSGEYNIIGMEKDWGKEITKITAIRRGDA